MRNQPAPAYVAHTLPHGPATGGGSILALRKARSLYRRAGGHSGRSNRFRGPHVRNQFSHRERKKRRSCCWVRRKLELGAQILRASPNRRPITQRSTGSLGHGGG